jgi:hypothetical protein
MTSSQFQNSMASAQHVTAQHSVGSAQRSVPGLVALLLTADANDVRRVDLQAAGFEVVTSTGGLALKGGANATEAAADALIRRVLDGEFSLVYVDTPEVWTGYSTAPAAELTAAVTRAAVTVGAAWIIESMGDATARTSFLSGIDPGADELITDHVAVRHMFHLTQAVQWVVHDTASHVLDSLDGSSFAVAPWMLPPVSDSPSVTPADRTPPSPGELTGMLRAAALTASSGHSPDYSEQVLGHRQAITGGRISHGHALTPSVVAACEAAAWSPPKFASERNRHAASRQQLQMEALPETIWPSRRQVLRRKRTRRKRQRGREFPPRVEAPSCFPPAGRSRLTQDSVRPAGPLAIHQLFYDGVYAEHVESWMLLADRAAQAIERRRQGADIDVPPVPTRVIGQDMQPEWARGCVWDTSNPSDCSPVRRSDASTTFRGSKQIDRAGLRRAASDLGWEEIDGDIVRQAGGGGIEAQSDCELMTVLSFHHAGLMDEVEAVASAVEKDFSEQWTDRPVRHLPFVPCRLLPKNVVMQERLRVLPDGISVEEYLKPRITTDASDGASESVNAGVPHEGRYVQLPKIQQHARAAAIIDTASDLIEPGEPPLHAASYVVDAESAFRFCPLQEADLWTQCYIWWSSDAAAGVCVDRRMAFGGAYSPNRFERVSTLVAAHVQVRQAEIDAAHPLPKAAARWVSMRKGWQKHGFLPSGSRQATPSYVQVYIDDFTGVALDDVIGHIQYLAHVAVDPQQMVALGCKPAEPGTRVFAHAQAAALALSDVGLHAAPTKILVGDPVVALGFEVAVGADSVRASTKKRSTMMADISSQAAEAEQGWVPVKRARTLVGRLTNLSQIFPEVKTYLRGGCAVTASLRQERRTPTKRKVRPTSTSGKEWQLLLSTAHNVLDANEGVSLAPCNKFPDLHAAGVMASITDASGNDGVGGYAFLEGAPDSVVIVSERWPPDIMAALEQNALPKAARNGGPVFTMPAAELFGAVAIPRAAAAALEADLMAVYAIGDCDPACFALNAAGSACRQMNQIISHARVSCTQWLAVTVPREANVDADILSHPARAGEVSVMAESAGLRVVRAPILEEDWRALRATLV